MNYLLALLALVFIVYILFSVKKVEKIPAKLKSSAKSFASGNQMVVGILVGLALCWVIGLFIKTEGFVVNLGLRQGAGLGRVYSIEAPEAVRGTFNGTNPLFIGQWDSASELDVLAEAMNEATSNLFGFFRGPSEIIGDLDMGM